MTPQALADATGRPSVMSANGSSAQAASGFVDYDADGGTFSLSPEQAMALADEDSPVYVASAFELIASAYIDEPKITEAFQTGKGVGWHEHHECLFRGTEKFFRPGYRANLVQAWLPALDGVVERLSAGGKAADIGCGAGASTLIMAQAFPNSRFTGFDYHDASIDRAREAAKEAGDPRQCQLRGRLGQGSGRRGLRSRRLLRLPARHGRSGRRGEAGALDAEGRRRVHAGRAVR